MRGRADRLRQDPRFAGFYFEWVEPWYYADVESTKRRLAAAGFEDIDVYLEEAPTPFVDAEAFKEFIATVCVRHHLAPLPVQERKMFLNELTIAAAAFYGQDIGPISSLEQAFTALGARLGHGADRAQQAHEFSAVAG